jgi:hypothetical protein
MIPVIATLVRWLVAALGRGVHLLRNAWLARVVRLPLPAGSLGVSPAAGASPAAVSLTLLLALPLAVGLVASRLAGLAATVMPARESRRLAQRSGPPMP